MQYIFLLLTILFSTQETLAQNPEENLKKYWHYRDRLVGKDGQGGFVDVGLGQGMSLPASERNPFTNCGGDWHLNNAGCSIQSGTGCMRWGDATVYHGYYIAVLALEYANLENAKQPVDAVAEELWYALEAVERLDSMAEVALGKPGKLDGFFLRDDVPGDFFVKKDAPKERRFAKENKRSFDCVASDYSCGKIAVENGGFISQDQVMGLFIGFMTVHKLIADKRYKKNLPTFGEKVAINAHRIAHYMMRCGWKLRDPDGNPIPDKWGGTAIGLSYPIAKIANMITGKKYQKNYLRKGALMLGLPIYDLLHLFLAGQSQTNVGLALTSMALLPKRGYKALGQKSKKHDCIVFPLLRAVLFKQKISKKIPLTDLEQMINSAPFDGPCFGTEDCTAPDGWKSYNRWMHPRFKNGNPYGVHSETPGLDFMLLYNLYHYYNATKLPEYKNN